MEYVFTFASTHHAVYAEELLKQLQIPVRVMPLPNALGASCGICLRVDPENFAVSKAHLAEKKVAVEGIYLAQDTAEGRVYEPWKS